ncbi:unnamed protein product [Effrenium voratum]|nr:unnamed protein product [Effrenium voratum]
MVRRSFAEEFLQLLDGSRADQRSIGEQEKIERMVSFLEMQNPMQRPAESMQLVGRWRLSFCGVNRGLQVQPALEAQKESQAGEIQSVSLEIAQDYSLKTEVVLGPNSVLVARQSPLKKPPPRGEVLKEEAGFKRYVKVTYLDDDLLILRGRAASEVYRKT